jgi:hypothetical protein
MIFRYARTQNRQGNVGIRVVKDHQQATVGAGAG